MKTLLAVVLALAAEAAWATPSLLPRIPKTRVQARAAAAARARSAVSAPIGVQVAEPAAPPALQDERGAPLAIAAAAATTAATTAAAADEPVHVIAISERAAAPEKAPLRSPPAALAVAGSRNAPAAQAQAAPVAAPVATEDADGDSDAGASPDSASPEDTALAGQEASPALLGEPAAAVVAVAEPPPQRVQTVVAVWLDDLRSLVDAHTPSGESVQVVRDALGELIEIIRDAKGNLISARGVDRGKGM